MARRKTSGGDGQVAFDFLENPCKEIEAPKLDDRPGTAREIYKKVAARVESPSLTNGQGSLTVRSFTCRFESCGREIYSCLGFRCWHCGRDQIDEAEWEKRLATY